MPTRDLKHISEVLPGVLADIREEQGALEYEQPKPRALDAVSRAREASYQVRAPQRTEAPAKPRRIPPAGSIPRGEACPACDCAATKLPGGRGDCSHCGLRYLRDGVTWVPVEHSVHDPRFSNGGK